MKPSWYGRRYPTFQDLAAFAEDLGAVVHLGTLPAAAFIPGEIPVLLIPDQHGPLASAWFLAHELGHLVQHTGPKGELFWSKNESQASRWAACALIPAARIRAHENACIDAFVGALSAHFEDLPLRVCPARRLAGRIARIRLSCLEVLCER